MAKTKSQFKNGEAESKKLWIKRMNTYVNWQGRLSRSTVIWSTQQLSRQKQEAVERAHVEELEFEKKKLELKQVQTEPLEITAMAINEVKMRKLVITKFDGTPQDWVRFWGQLKHKLTSPLPWSDTILLLERISGFKGEKSYRWPSIYPRMLLKG